MGYNYLSSSFMLNATFNNNSVKSWRSVLLVEETGLPGENLSQVTHKLYHLMLYQIHLTMSGIRTHNFSKHYHFVYCA